MNENGTMSNIARTINGISNFKKSKERNLVFTFRKKKEKIAKKGLIQTWTLVYKIISKKHGSISNIHIQQMRILTSDNVLCASF